MVNYVSGIPFDSQSVNPANAKKERIHGEKMPAGIEMPCFETYDDARDFCMERISILPAVMGLIGFYLDVPVNRLGNSGWDVIYEMVKDINLIDALLAK